MLRCGFSVEGNAEGFVVMGRWTKGVKAKRMAGEAGEEWTHGRAAVLRAQRGERRCIGIGGEPWSFP